MKCYFINKIKTILLIVLASQSLFALELEVKDGQKTYNEVDNKYKAEEGWRFYEDNPKTKERIEKTRQQEKKDAYAEQVKLKQADQTTVLMELLKESKKQTALQTEIRDLLKATLDPAPEIIAKNDGTTCIANSNADCFKMPLTPEAKRVPALRNWMEKGDEESAKNFLQWQAKYFQEIFKRGNNIQYAILNNGTQAYPMDYWDKGFVVMSGADSAIRIEAEREKLKNAAKKFDYLIFIGENPDMDLFSMDSVASLINQLPDNKFYLVFSKDGAKRLYEEGAEAIPTLQKAWANPNVAKTVNPQLFKEYEIYTTPTAVIRHRNKDGLKTQKIAVGRVGGDAIEKTIEYLKTEGVFEYGDDAGYKVWRNNGDYASKHIKRQYNIDVNTTKVRELMK